MASPTLRLRPNATFSKENTLSQPATTPTEKSTSSPKASVSETDEDEGPIRISIADILRILAGLFILNSALSFFITGNSITWNYRPAFTNPARVKAWLRGPLDLTDAQLTLYNGSDTNLPILLAVNGTIYDVSASPHLYGPGGSYAFFSGRDATRAFVTGCFDIDLNGDLRGVEEMFISTDLTEEPGESPTKEERRERKLRREREGRLARRKVEETVKGWASIFDGGKDGKYFRVGRVHRGEGSGWEGWGEVKELCAKAREGRPRRTAEEVA